MQWLIYVHGVGPKIATALVAALGTGSSFVKRSDLAAWLGLVPWQITTGNNARLIDVRRVSRDVILRSRKWIILSKYLAYLKFKKDLNLTFVRVWQPSLICNEVKRHDDIRASQSVVFLP